MRPTPWDCPYCGREQEFLLVYDQNRHLRQCATCDGWFIIHEGAATPDGNDAAVKTLGDPATCPVDGCEETFRGDGIVNHLVGQHDGSFTTE